jgi:hypothetical protein
VGPEEEVGSLYNVPGTEIEAEVPGYGAGEVCPAGESSPFVRSINSTMVFNNGVPGGPPGGGVTRFPTSATIDTVGVSESRPTALLTDTGVPFVFRDEDVVNNFTYFYAVTAFDVNSMASGPYTLRSVQVTSSTIPSATNSALQAGFEADVIVSGDDGVPLDLDGPQVAPDPDTGIFPAPQNPTNALGLLVEPPPAEVADLLAPGQLTGRFDSVTAEDISFGCAASGGNALGACLVVHMTFDNGIEQTSSSLEIARTVYDGFGEAVTVQGPLGAGLYPFDDERLADFGIPPGAGPGVAAGLTGTFDMTISDPSFLGQRVRRFQTGRYEPGGNRWFDGTVNDTRSSGPVTSTASTACGPRSTTRRDSRVTLFTTPVGVTRLPARCSASGTRWPSCRAPPTSRSPGGRAERSPCGTSRTTYPWTSRSRRR